MAGLSGAEWSAVKHAVRRYQGAVKALGEFSENRVTYFEDSPSKNAECQRRWQELNDAGAALTTTIDNLDK